MAVKHVNGKFKTQ